MVRTAHSVTRPLDRLATEYPTYAWSSLILYTSSPTPTMILIATRHVAPVTCTPRDKQTRFSTQTDMGRTTKTSRIQIQNEVSQLLITSKPRYWPLGLSISPLMGTLTIKNTNFEFWIQDTWSTARRRKNLKASKWHKKWKTNQNGKEELRKT
jgi:hypothetical protein